MPINCIFTTRYNVSLQRYIHVCNRCGAKRESATERYVRVCDKQEISFAEKVMHFADATVRWAARGFKRRKLRNIRRIFHDICRKCEMYLGNEEHGICGQCGCNLAPDNRTMNLLTFATEPCPLGKFKATARRGGKCLGCQKK